MIIVVKSLGVIFILAGIVFLVKPEIVKKTIAFLSCGRRIYGVGVLRVFIGILFILSASRAHKEGIILTLGIIILLSGIGVFLLGSDRLKKILSWYADKPFILMRIAAVLLISFGVLTIYAA